MVEQMRLLISIMAGLCTVMLSFGVYRLRRVQALASDRLAEDGAGPIDQAIVDVELNERFVTRVLKPILKRCLAVLGRVTPAGNVDRLQRDLVLAGRPANLTLLDFLGFKFLIALLVGAIVFALLIARQMAPMSALLFSLAGAMVGLYGPNFWLRSRKKGRQKAIRRALPDALDMLSICVDAGLGFEAALMKVAQRWENQLTAEFRRVVGEVHMGVRRSEALRHVVDRTDVPEVASFVAVLVQADKLGVGITNVLHSQSQAARQRRRQRAEEAGRKAPIKMLVPLVFFIFPAMFVVILGPAVPRFIDFFGGMG
jgi:tight adherence protein C